MRTQHLKVQKERKYKVGNKKTPGYQNTRVISELQDVKDPEGFFGPKLEPFSAEQFNIYLAQLELTLRAFLRVAIRSTVALCIWQYPCIITGLATLEHSKW